MREFLLLSIVVLIISLISLNEVRLSVASDADGKVSVNFYVMSKCPDAEACEIIFSPALHQVSSIIDLHVDFIARDIGNLTCPHGPTECIGDIQQVCVEYLYRNLSSVPSLTWWDFDVCQSQTRTQIPDNGPSCAQNLSLSYPKINECVNSTIGVDLVKASFNRTVAANQTISCTINLNQAFWCQHNGNWVNCAEGTDAQSLVKAICKRYTGSNPPPACSSYLAE